MSSRPSTHHASHPHASVSEPGGGVNGERKRAPRSMPKRIWGYFTRCFRPQLSHSDVASPVDRGMRYNRKKPHKKKVSENQQKPESRQLLGLPETSGSLQGHEYRYGAPHYGTQARHHTIIPPGSSVGYPPHQPLRSGQQVHTVPPEVSSGKEIMIAVMGVTGAGKSYFIREVSGNSQVRVSGDLYSCTREVQSYSFEYEGVKITLVDTPGFNDTNRSDTEVLREIADWATETYKEERLLSGIIYLHPITHARMEGSALRNLKMFRSLCGQEFLSNVLLTTTQWSNVDPVEGGARENSLRNQDFWGGLIGKGAALQRFNGTRESGLELIGRLMPKNRKPLDIQDQIVEQNRTLLETDAGQFINEELIAQAKRHKEEIESLEREWQGAIGERDNEIREILAAEQARFRKNIEKVSAEKKLLAELDAKEVGKREGREMGKRLLPAS